MTSARILAVMTTRSMDWMDRGACRDAEIPDEWFFPGRGESLIPAKRVCAGCPVREDCLEYALDACEKWGVWGGLSERERRRVRRQRAKGLIMGLPPIHFAVNHNPPRAEPRQPSSLSKSEVKKGSRNPRARLTEADIPEIRRLRDLGWQHREIAERFGVSTGTIGQVCRRVSWAHVA